MPAFSTQSRTRLDTCNHHLIVLFEAVVNLYDCTIIEGHRPRYVQNFYFRRGVSKLMWPLSKHNSESSLAADVAPYINGRISWDSAQCRHFGGFVQGVAAAMGIKIRWGGDWDQDRDINDQTFNDLVHFEMVPRSA